MHQRDRRRSTRALAAGLADKEHLPLWFSILERVELDLTVECEEEFWHCKAIGRSKFNHSLTGVLHDAGILQVFSLLSPLHEITIPRQHRFRFCIHEEATRKRGPRACAAAHCQVLHLVRINRALLRRPNEPPSA